MRTLTLFVAALLAVLRGQAQQPGPALPAGTGLQASYYNGTNFETLILRRRDAVIDFDWKKQPPVKGLGPEFFSVRWEGYLLAPTTGEYEFSTVMDDGLRVWVGGKRIIDAWREHDHVPASVRLRLEAGRYYRLRVDYFQTILDSRAVLRWRLPNSSALVPVGQQAFFAALPTSAKPVPKPQPPAPAPVVAAVPAPRTPPQLLASRPPATRPAATPVRRVVAPRRTPAAPARPTLVPPGRIFGDSLTDLSKLRRGEALALKRIYFVQSQARLLPSSEPELGRLVRLLREQPDRRFEIAGHTDNVGDPHKNQVLSEQRARVVRAYLLRRGIDSLRLTAVGYGGTRPVADNRDPQQRPRNRRVELVAR
ncbi:OmpA family protein [Hymenobacter sp. 15J16-1T3B]|uniref:PA14 domain-containing protein n=1 Tax=Hymenobacter sp. 15J16-1T3B TaxID=2886941 RepID=UPI001D0F87B4|nr:PA14 domain-containing protein [Hymenobacter sp. 15J16-1T3B]MCC3156265.1 OmpA family protein [Hymenobacter sp. 15J16-1T3B]